MTAPELTAIARAEGWLVIDMVTAAGMQVFPTADGRLEIRDHQWVTPAGVVMLDFVDGCGSLRKQLSEHLPAVSSVLLEHGCPCRFGRLGDVWHAIVGRNLRLEVACVGVEFPVNARRPDTPPSDGAPLCDACAVQLTNRELARARDFANAGFGYDPKPFTRKDP